MSRSGHLPPNRLSLWLGAVALLLACNLATSRPADLRTPAPGEPPAANPPTASEEPAAAPSQPPDSTAEQPPSGDAPNPPTGVGPRNFPPGVNPLTGLTVSDPGLLDRRPVAVKINNYPRSNRPQWGLSLADIVYEYYHNNDLPRFHAIFYSQDAELAGPIRSGRLLDVHLVEMYQSDFVFGSADERILGQLLAQPYRERLLYLLDGLCPPTATTPMCRLDPGGYNLLMTGTQAVRQYLFDYREQRDDPPNLEGMWFNPGLPQGGREITHQFIRYSYGAYLYWEWDPTTGRYLRYQDTQEDLQGRGMAYDLLTDRLTGQPISADNVVVLRVEHDDFVYQPPREGNPAVEIIDILLEGSGPAYALRDGILFEVRWVRPYQGVLTLTFQDGSPYPFKPGNTWFQVVNRRDELVFDGTTARITFAVR